MSIDIICVCDIAHAFTYSYLFFHVNDYEFDCLSVDYMYNLQMDMVFDTHSILA